MIGELLQYLGGTLLMLGALLAALAGLGLLRFPDLYTRLHAASLGSIGLGIGFVALAVTAPDLGMALRAMLGLTFVILTSPVVGHLLARAFRKSVSRETNTSVDTGRPAVK